MIRVSSVVMDDMRYRMRRRVSLKRKRARADMVCDILDMIQYNECEFCGRRFANIGEALEYYDGMRPERKPDVVRYFLKWLARENMMNDKWLRRYKESMEKDQGSGFIRDCLILLMVGYMGELGPMTRPMGCDISVQKNGMWKDEWDMKE